MNFWQLILLILAPFLAGLSLFLFKKVASNYIYLVLSFSGAYLFSITVLHLIPDIFNSSSSYLGIYVLLGFFIQLVLEQFTAGIEHGHMHPPEKPGISFTFGIMIGLSIHAFLEGIPLAYQFNFENSQQNLLYGIVLHKIPAAFALMSVLVSINKSNLTSILLLSFFVMMTPLAALLTGGAYGSESSLNMFELLKPEMAHFKIILAIVIGSFLHISTTILFEASTKIHKFTLLKILAILLGSGIAILTLD
ncbi:MAG: ZIP family metal transporter [Bacteroidetes bacterium]|nr:ZIP family metal transporter [Bacteroidota bacterium]